MTGVQTCALPILCLHQIPPRSTFYWIAFIGLICLFLLALFTISPLQWLFPAKYEHLAQPLWLREEDLGGNRGVWHLRNVVTQYAQEAKDPAEKSLLACLRKELPQLMPTTSRDPGVETDPQKESPPSNEPPEVVRFSASDLVKSKGLVKFVGGARFQALLNTLSDLSQVRLTLPDLKGQDSLPDLVDMLNTWLRQLNDPRFWEIEGKRGSRQLEEGNNPDETGKVMRLKEDVWAQLRPFVGNREQSLAAESLHDHHNTPMTDINRYIFLRQLFQEMFDPFLKPWSLDFLTSTRTLEIADALNAELRGGDGSDRTVTKSADFDKLVANRNAFNCLLDRIADRLPVNSPAREILRSSRQVRDAGNDIKTLRLYRLWLARVILGLGFALLIIITIFAIRKSTDVNGAFLSGTSPIPTLFGLLIAIGFSVIFWVASLSQTKRAMLEIVRKYRLTGRDGGDSKVASPNSQQASKDSDDQGRSRSDSNIGFWATMARRWKDYRLPAVPEHQSPVNAELLWRDYRSKIGIAPRAARIAILVVFYMTAVFIFFWLSGHGQGDTIPLRSPCQTWNNTVSVVAVLGFVLLAFNVLDTALICAWFIRCLTQGPTNYPIYTIKAIRDRYGPIDRQVVANYIDVKLIHQITSGIGTTLYFPAIVLSILLVSYNPLTYTWPWPPSWFAIIAGHFAIAGAGVLALQHAAKASRDKCVEELEFHLNHQRVAQAQSQAAMKDALLDRAQELVAEVRGLREGAFAGVANNPVLGATLLPIGSVLVLELLKQALTR